MRDARPAPGLVLSISRAEVERTVSSTFAATNLDRSSTADYRPHDHVEQRPNRATRRALAKARRS